jgi:Ca2+-binding RTX toxin-like protein
LARESGGGDAGNDEIAGGNGADGIEGGTGDDLISGGDGADRIEGGEHDDRLFGNGGDDLIFGDEGNDVINGGSGLDRLTGGAGNDRFVFADTGDKVITDFNAVVGEDDVANVAAFFKSINQVKKSSVVGTFDGIANSTEITYVDKDEKQATLTLLGYDINTDANVADHFIVSG